MIKRIWIFLAVIAALVALFVAISSFIGLQVVAASTQLVTNAETRLTDDFWVRSGFDYERFRNQYTVEEIAIPSSFEDHVIPADYIYAPKSGNSKNHPTVILVHGLGDNRYANYPLAEFFLELGYNVIPYDQRSTNENTARYTTFGYLEKFDLSDWVSYSEQHAPGQKIGILGTSFGGATAGLALGYANLDKKVDFLILDCPVSSMEWMVQQEMKSMDIGIPVGYMTWSGNIINKLKLGFSYHDADVPRALKDVSTPVLVINSRLDSVTPYFMGQDIYDALPEKSKAIWTVEDSEHGEIWTDHNSEYRERIKNFLANVREG